jgi:arginase
VASTLCGVDVALILVGSHAGDESTPSSEGPALVVAAGAEAALARRGIGVSVDVVRRPGPFRDTASSASAVNRLLAESVRAAAAGGRMPIVLAGSCNAALGVLAGMDHSGWGVVWLDAHADFNTPESTVSGFFPGMSTAIILGHCYQQYWASIGDATPLREDAFVLLGVRDLSPAAERERLKQSSVRLVPWMDGQPQQDPDQALDELRRRVHDVYLHIDLDAFAPDVAPGVADTAVPGGLSAEQGEAMVSAVARRFRIRAATIATYAPRHDSHDATLKLTLHLLDLLGQGAELQP